MDYQSANKQLQGRCYQSRKLENNTYLRRRGKDIAVQLHSTDVLTFKSNGSITIATGGWNTIITTQRINGYLPRPWRVGRERGEMFLCRMGDIWERLCVIHGAAEITKRGKVTGGSVAKVLAQWKVEDKESRRQAYWIRKARGLERDRSQCTQRWCRCHSRGGGRPASSFVGHCDHCGCTVTRVQYKCKLTVAQIMAEDNITVRMAMANVYGLDRFLVDARAQTIDTYGEYALLDMPMGQWQAIRALKMTCPSTGAVYISPVEPRTRTVAEALDWMFQTEDYLGQVSQQA